MAMNEKKFNALLNQLGPKRHSHFVKVAADLRQVWGLHSEGWALAATNEGDKVFPLWPSREFAEACADREWSGYVPKEIDLTTLLDALIPKLRASATLAAVFPTPSNKGVTPDLSQLEADIRFELSRIE